VRNGDQVETPVGVGRVIEVRSTPSGVVVLVEIMPGGFGRGDSDVFGLDEVNVVSPDVTGVGRGPEIGSRDHHLSGDEENARANRASS